MTTSLCALLVFAVWTMLLVLSVGLWRVTLVLRGVKKAGEFTPGVPHGTDLYWRLNRAHLNCVENLPVFATLVLLGNYLALNLPWFDRLAVWVIAARLCQTTAHLISGRGRVVRVRFFLFLTQLIAMLSMAVMVALYGHGPA